MKDAGMPCETHTPQTLYNQYFHQACQLPRARYLNDLVSLAKDWRLAINSVPIPMPLLPDSWTSLLRSSPTQW